MLPCISDFALEIVVLNDDIARRGVLSAALRAAGHHVTVLDLVEEIHEMSSDWRFDIAVIDAHLTGESGLSLAARLRVICPSLGLVMLTRRHQLLERIQAYLNGVDVCLGTPVDPGELLMVIESLARRLNQTERGESTAEFVLDVEFETLANSSESLLVALTNGEMHIFQNLALAPMQRLESWQLIEIMRNQFSDRGKKNLEVAISRIRAKLRFQGFLRPVILTERGFGYRLCVPLRLA
jgi:DNA-binding response OmpR family regulator